MEAETTSRTMERKLKPGFRESRTSRDPQDYRDVVSQSLALLGEYWSD